MADRTKIDLPGHIAIPEELRRKYGLYPHALADVISTDDGLLVRKTAIIEDSSDTSHNTAPPSSPANPEPIKKWPDEGVEYRKDTDTLLMPDGLVIEQAAEKLRRVLTTMLRYVDELDEKAANNIPLPVLEDIIRIPLSGQIKVAKEFRHRFGLHPNAEVDITDAGDGLLIRKVADSENPIDRMVGSIPPGGIVDQLSGTDTYVRQIRGR